MVAFNLLAGQMQLPTDVSRFIAKAMISTYLSFFPVTVGMVKGLRSPDPFHLDLMRTYSATPLAGVLEAALALVAALPVRVDEDRGRREPGRRHRRRAAHRRGRRHRRQLLTGSYYSQSIQMWSALVVGSLLAALLVAAVGIAERIVLWRMGGGRAMNPSPARGATGRAGSRSSPWSRRSPCRW